MAAAIAVAKGSFITPSEALFSLFLFSFPIPPALCTLPSRALFPSPAGPSTPEQPASEPSLSLPLPLSFRWSFPLRPSTPPRTLFPSLCCCFSLSLSNKLTLPLFSLRH
ncbi:hypothetical protein AAC387_Pa12g2152 [Persea americana]